MEDKSRAISFANSYFSLVDGLAPGLKDHLAKDVVLDWFGRTIIGREKVTEFIRSHKIGSRHVFNNIAPVASIDYRKSQTHRKISSLETDNCNGSRLLEEELNFDKLSINDPENNNVVFKNPEDRGNSESTDFDGNKTEEISTTYELRENDLANLFALEITPTVDEGIEEGMSRIKKIKKVKKGEKSSTKGRVLAIENSPEFEKSNSVIKYVEANGQIEFSKKSIKRGTELQTWKRQSKLQIAYSLITDEEICEDHDEEEEEEEEEGEEEEEAFYREMETDDSQISKTGRSVYKVNRLPSLEEITDISNNLVPNINNFGGYFPTFDFFADRDNFLLNFNAELSLKNSTASLRTPLQYVDNRLVFPEINERVSKSRSGDDDEGANRHDGNRFVFNYLIHLIVYQGISKCRRSLSQEFESSYKSNKRFLAAGLE